MLEGEECAVYLFGYPHATFGHVVKVGISSNASYRLSQIQACNPDVVEMHFVFRFRSRDLARRIEQTFHREFSHHGIRGEWFGMSEQHALFMLTMVVVRCLSASYGSEVVALIRKECGLLRAFEQLDQMVSDADEEAFNNEWYEVTEGEPA